MLLACNHGLFPIPSRNRTAICWWVPTRRGGHHVALRTKWNISGRDPRTIRKMTKMDNPVAASLAVVGIYNHAMKGPQFVWLLVPHRPWIFLYVSLGSGRPSVKATSTRLKSYKEHCLNASNGFMLVVLGFLLWRYNDSKGVFHTNVVA